MKLVPSRPVRRLLAGLTPIALLVAALPLMAPTCGGFQPGVKTFAKNTIIIPMDVCYQCTVDGDGSTAPSSCGVTGYQTATGTTTNGLKGGQVCPQATKQGDVVKAYGLVYQLIRNGISVYWVINQTKTHLDDYDLTVQYNAGAPVQAYNWTGGGTLATPLPTSASAINYMGGVFVVDGSDFAAANLLLQDGSKIDKTTFSAVNLHVSNVAFQAYVAKSMAGGWDAGLAKIPKLGLVDIASSGSGSKNSYIVIAGYLLKAGLTNNINNPWPLGGTSAAGNHGQIFDRLTLEDFLPRLANGSSCTDYATNATCDWKLSTFYKNTFWGRQAVDSTATDGYTALWVPHWTAPSSCKTCSRSGTPISCSDCGTSCSCDTEYSAAEVSAALRTIGLFQKGETDKAGGDLFAECAGLGSFDGVPGNSIYNAAGIVQTDTHFQTLDTGSGYGFNIETNTPAAPAFLGSYPNPLMQIGDFQFVAHSGAISTYQPKGFVSPSGVTGYKTTPLLARLITESPDTGRDVFTVLPNVNKGSGSTVYMGGHSYSGTDSGAYSAAGTRLVLNTLFNLGATCIANGASCSTGLLGICAAGTMKCDANGAPYCDPIHDPGTVAETCNGLDDDCNGLIDDNIPAVQCYTGPSTTYTVDGSGNILPKGLCHVGAQSCTKRDDGTFGLGTCIGQQLPATEICDGLDNDCNGTVDDGIAARACYTGPSTSINPGTGLPMGICKQGTQACGAGTWGTCTGQVLPASEYCGDTGGGDGLDNDCNGLVDEGCGCPTTPPDNQRACYTGPASSYTIVGTTITPKGDCAVGSQLCTSGVWGSCVGEKLPAAEENCSALDGDADCNGVIARNEPACQSCSDQSCYEGPASSLAPSGLPRPVCATGLRTVCTDGTMGACTGQILPSPEVCDGKDNDCNGAIDDGAQCGAGLSCVNGNCVRTTCGGELRCPAGYECRQTDWTCQPELCPSAPCPSGQRCEGGTCIDPCASVTCGPGTICSGGVCTGGACYLTGCDAGFECRNGSCVPNPCASLTCPTGSFCRDNNGVGDCVQSCTEVSCPAGQRCGVDGFCVADTCAGITCNAGQLCIDGHCVANACNTIACGTGKICDRGTCKDDPCTSTVCPTGVCLARDAIECAQAPCLQAQCYPITNLSGAGTATPTSSEGGGCSCGQGDASSAGLFFLVGIGLLPLARRRRRPSALPLLVALAATGLLTGCPGDKTEEQATCGTSCNAAGTIVAPFISSISPASGLKGSPKPVVVTLTGTRFQPKASARIFPTGAAVVVDTQVTDSNHAVVTLDLSGAEFEPYLLRLVNPDSVISNLATFDAVAMPPIATSVTPTGVTAPTVATLTVSGSNFTPLSQCWIAVGSYAVALPSALVDPTKDDKLSCTLDTAKVSAGATKLWVVNEQGLLAKAPESTPRLDFTVTGALAVTAVSPPSVLTSSTVVLTVYGAGFDSNCKVTVNGVALTTNFVDPTRLTATYTTPATPGNVDVTVTKTGATTPAAVQLLVVTTSSGNTVTSLSPQSAYQGQTGIVLTFTGSGDLGGSTVQFLPPGGTWSTTAWTVTGTGTSVTRSMDFTPATSWPSGDYQVRLKFSDGSTSATFPFTLVSNVPNIWSFTATSQKQGTASSTVTATGTTIFTGASLALLGSGGFSRAATGSSNTATTVTGTFSLTNMDTGAYQLVAKNTTSTNSNPLTFTVLPGDPVLTSISPTCVVQGNTIVTLTLTGNNFAKPDSLGAGGSIILARNPGLGIPDPLVPASAFQIPSTAVTVSKYDTITIGFDTTTAVPSNTNPYKVKVSNPGSSIPSAEVDLYVKTTSCP